MNMKLLSLGALSSAALVASANAQSVNWAEFTLDNSRLVAASDIGLGDDEEKDYAFADFDKNGYTDLIVVRKQPFTTTGRRRNVLFMNQGGTLVDETMQYATASDVPGDQGFMTNTNDRDVAVGDLKTTAGWTSSPRRRSLRTSPRQSATPASTSTLVKSAASGRASFTSPPAFRTGARTLARIHISEPTRPY